MPRTTVNIDSSVLRSLKLKARAEGKNVGQLISEIVARSLASVDSMEPIPELRWLSQPMGAKVDLEDKEAMRAALDEG